MIETRDVITLTEKLFRYSDAILVMLGCAFLVLFFVDYKIFRRGSNFSWQPSVRIAWKVMLSAFVLYFFCELFYNVGYVSGVPEVW